MDAPLGAPFSCKVMGSIGKLKTQRGQTCQFVNVELAAHTAGSKEPVPCCKYCDEPCAYECERAAELRGEEEVKTAKQESENAQLELPVMKNNNQRKEWLESYKEWGLWYRDEHIDVNYYKYDFADGSRLIVEEYPQRERYWSKEKSDEYFFHLLEKKRQKYDHKNTYDVQYMHAPDSETYLVDFLKKLQKK